MEVIDFKPEHKPILAQWLELRKLPLDSLNSLPQIGYIALEGDNFVSAGFLRKVEGGYGMIDSFVANPATDRGVRSEAIDLVTMALIAKAKNLNLAGLIAMTVHNGTLERSLRLGFVQREQAIMTFDLKGRSLP